MHVTSGAVSDGDSLLFDRKDGPLWTSPVVPPAASESGGVPLSPPPALSLAPPTLLPLSEERGRDVRSSAETEMDRWRRASAVFRMPNRSALRAHARLLRDSLEAPLSGLLELVALVWCYACRGEA